MTYRVRAHAKYNPYLWVGRPRSDGYHDIDTILQAVELHDVLTVSPSSELRITCTDPSLNGEANLVFKAFRLCSELARLPLVEVHIEKNIPTEAGMGGGSSDAAAAMRIFNRVSRGALSAHLVEIGMACGSDVPFFLGSSGRARARGRGEIVTTLESAPKQSVVLAKPNEAGCSTSEAYERLDAQQNRPDTRPETMPYNDFERVAPRESLDLLERLRSLGAQSSGLCGSGSAVYAETEDAAAIASQLALEGYWSFATNTVRELGEPWTL